MEGKQRQVRFQRQRAMYTGAIHSKQHEMACSNATFRLKKNLVRPRGIDQISHEVTSVSNVPPVQPQTLRRSSRPRTQMTRKSFDGQNRDFRLLLCLRHGMSPAQNRASWTGRHLLSSASSVLAIQVIPEDIPASSWRMRLYVHENQKAIVRAAPAERTTRSQAAM